MNVRHRIKPTNFLTFAIAIGSSLCFTNAGLAQSFNLAEIDSGGQETFQLAKQISDNAFIKKLSCLHSHEINSSPETLLAQVIIDSRPSYDSRCGDYYTTQKNGKYYECIKCEYSSEPYCWERNDLN